MPEKDGMSAVDLERRSMEEIGEIGYGERQPRHSTDDLKICQVEDCKGYLDPVFGGRCGKCGK